MQLEANGGVRPKVALVVGAGDFIGAAIARRFAAGGFTVALGRRTADKLAPLVEEIEGSGGKARAYALDAREESRIEEVFADIEANLGPLEVVVFNVGANVRFPIRDTTSRVFRKVWEMACWAGFLTGREAAKYMVPRGRGAILFTGATASLRGGTGYAAFASAKFGLRALAQSMARELGPENIHVAHLVIVGARAHFGGRRGSRRFAGERAHEPGFGGRGLLDSVSTNPGCVDVRTRSTSAPRNLVRYPCAYSPNSISTSPARMHI
jgi:short-subunit dehydrogenase